MKVADDQSWVERAKRGEHRALEELYARYRRPLLGYLRRWCQNPAVADDVFQEAWIKVWNHLHRFDAKQGTFRSWLYQVATNTARDEARKARVRQADSLDEPVFNEGATKLELIEDKAVGQEHRAVSRQEVRQLLNLLNTLPEPRKAAVLLRHQQGFSYAEIGKLLNVPEGTAKTMVHRGLKTLRQQMDSLPAELKS